MCNELTGSEHVSKNDLLEGKEIPFSQLGEVVVLISYLKKQGILAKLRERIQFARRRFGRGSRDRFSRCADRAMRGDGERTLETFYESLQPFAVAFMAGAGQ